MYKKGDFAWETIAKYLVAFIILVIILILVAMFKDKLYNLFDVFKGVF